MSKGSTYGNISVLPKPYTSKKWMRFLTSSMFNENGNVGISMPIGWDDEKLRTDRLGFSNFGIAMSNLRKSWRWFRRIRNLAVWKIPKKVVGSDSGFDQFFAVFGFSSFWPNPDFTHFLPFRDTPNFDHSKIDFNRSLHRQFSSVDFALIFPPIDQFWKPSF